MSNPQAYITVRKSRIAAQSASKNSARTVYLQKDSEFEIELYNPTQDRIGALITLSGKRFPSYVILRPGERIYVERFLDEAKKFKFDTYFVDNSAETKKAIEKNKSLKVQFYQERVYTPPVQSVPVWPTNNIYYFYDQNAKWRTPNFTLTTSGSSDVVGYSAEVQSNYNVNSSLRSKSFATMDGFIDESVETGRVEKGSHSNQNFSNVSIELESWSFHEIEFDVLPVSQQPKEEATLYCSNCGRRARKKENFCPKCGNKH